MKFTNKEGHEVTIIDFTKGSHTRSRIAHVLFEDGTIVHVRTTKIRSGSFLNPNFPRVYGVGCIGQGEYKSSIKGKPSRAYRKWESMISRCYNLNDVNYSSYGGKGVYVEDSWKNYQNFAEWFYRLESSRGKDFELDKDIKGTLGEINYYSEDTCCLVPKVVNSLFRSVYSSNEVRQRVEGVYESYRHNKDGSSEKLVSSRERCIVEDSMLSEKVMTLYKIRRVLERNLNCNHLIKDIDRHIRHHYNMQQVIRDKLQIKEKVL